MTKSETKLKS